MLWLAANSFSSLSIKKEPLTTLARARGFHESHAPASGGTTVFEIVARRRPSRRPCHTWPHVASPICRSARAKQVPRFGIRSKRYRIGQAQLLCDPPSPRGLPAASSNLHPFLNQAGMARGGLPNPLSRGRRNVCRE